MNLDPVTQRFILHWGEMGTRWGVNRTVAQIHALLYLSEQPLHAEEITNTLSVARSNVSASLRELQAWGIVRVVHVIGDRRDHFESMKDVWEMFRIIVRERKRREVDPTITVLKQCVQEVQASKSLGKHARAQLSQLLDFFQQASQWYEQIDRLPTRELMRFVKLGSKVGKMLGVKAT